MAVSLCEWQYAGDCLAVCNVRFLTTDDSSISSSSLQTIRTITQGIPSIKVVATIIIRIFDIIDSSILSYCMKKQGFSRHKAVAREIRRLVDDVHASKVMTMIQTKITVTHLCQTSMRVFLLRSSGTSRHPRNITCCRAGAWQPRPSQRIQSARASEAKRTSLSTPPPTNDEDWCGKGSLLFQKIIQKSGTVIMIWLHWLWWVQLLVCKHVDMSSIISIMVWIIIYIQWCYQIHNTFTLGI